MTITFHGAARMVTGSKHLLKLNSGLTILLDCGLVQGNPAEADKLNRHFGFNPGEVDYLILSHAHIDHCGLIPRFVREGFRGKIFCTPATFELAKILLLDSAHIHEADIIYHNKKRTRRGEKPVEALYTTDDVYNAMSFFEQVPYNYDKKLADNCSFSFTNAGHIIGAAAVHLNITESGKSKRITFSGDVGRYNDALLNAPEEFGQADYIILESTYGDELHQDAVSCERQLLEIMLETCFRKQGKLIIPAFSVGRTQEIVYALNRLDIAKHLPDVNFYVDSPLSVSATGIMKNFLPDLNAEFTGYMKTDPEPFDFNKLHYITDIEESKKLNFSNEACVIISASGMADAGRVKHHIKHAIDDRKNTILFVGYCEPRSLGGKLMRGNKEVTIFGEPFDVKAEIKSIRSLSAHGDYDDLCRFIGNQKPELVKKLFLVHGEYEVQQVFKSKLVPKGFKHVEIPVMHQQYEL